MDGGLISKAILGDCMDVMREYPDKYFDLAVVDPPYGGGGVILKDKKRQDSAGKMLFCGGRRSIQVRRPRTARGRDRWGAGARSTI